jgi:hypothetical protein
MRRTLPHKGYCAGFLKPSGQWRTTLAPFMAGVSPIGISEVAGEHHATKVIGKGIIDECVPGI